MTPRALLLHLCLIALAPLLLAACGGGGGGGGPTSAPPAFQPNALFGTGGAATGQGSLTVTTYDRADVAGDGSMALVGKTQGTGGTFGILLVEKRLPDGSPDTSFGASGHVQLGTPLYAPKDIALNAQDGSVIVAADHGLQGYTLLKLKANGAPDTTFGANGVKEVVTSAFAKLAGMVVEADGRIVVAGFTGDGPFIMRYTAAGAADPTWNGGVPYTFTIFGSQAYIQALVRRSGGGYLVAGRTFEPGDNDKLIVGRFGTNGLPVPSFGSAGFLIYTPPFSLETAGLIARPGGGAVVYGRKAANTAFALGVSATGGIEAGFGYQELTSTTIQSSRGATQTASDGHITLGYADLDNNLLLWRIRADGSSDPGFGIGGLSVIPVAEGTSFNAMEPHAVAGFLLLGNRRLGGGAWAGIVLHLVE